MAYLVTSADDDALSASMHGLISRNDLEYLRDRAARTFGSGSRFSEYTARAFEILDGFDLESLKIGVERIRRRFSRSEENYADEILEMLDLDAFRDARPKQRRFIMANPRLVNLKRRGLISGYDGLYSDEEPDTIPELRMDYLIATTGMIRYDEDQGGVDEVWTTHLRALDTYGEQELSHYEKVIVTQGWEEINKYLDSGYDDPTSPEGNPM